VKAQSEFLKECIVVFIIAVFAAALYSYTLGFGFVWDDDHLIVNNPYIKNAEYIPAYFVTDMWRLSASPRQSLYYRPFYMALFSLEYAVWGLNAKMFHLINILFLTLASLLLYSFIRDISGSRTASLLSALLFISHSVTAQAVSWISAITEFMVLIFLLSAFIMFKKAMDAVSEKKRIILYAGSVSMFAFALLSKESAIFFIPLLMWYGYCVISKFNLKTLFKNIKDYTPYVLVLFLYAWTRNFVFGPLGWVCVRDPAGLPLPTTLLMTFKSIPFYVKSMIFPLGIEIQALKIPVVPPLDFAGAASVAALALFLIWYVLKYGTSRKDEVFFLGWAAIAFVPILLTATLMGSRFLVFPIVGILAFLSLFFTRLTFKMPPVRKVLCYTAFAIVLVLCAFSSYRSTLCLKDDRALLKMMVSNHPEDADVHYNIGYLYSKDDNLKPAISEYKEVLRIDPTHKRARFNLAHAYYSLGDMDKSAAEFKELLRQDASMPYVHQALAVICDKKGHREEAIKEVKEELSLNPPDYPKMLEFLAYLYEKGGQGNESTKIARLAMRRCAVRVSR
jgi:Tfp pilus assembly protein PilF